MGLIKKGLVFGLGAIWGMYVAQNYDVPDIKKTLDSFMSKAKKMEETHRKDLDAELDKPKNPPKA